MNTIVLFRTIIIHALLCLTLSSCVPVGTRDMNATSSPIAEIAPTATLTPVKIPTFTQVSPPTATNMVIPQPTVGLTSTWTPSPTPITIGEIHTCQGEGVPAPLPDEFGFEGTMLYISDWGMYTVGGIPLIFSSEPIFDFGVGWLGDTFSPNGEWLIYRPAISTIGLVSYQGDWIENNLDLSDFNALADPGYMISRVRAHSWINNELVHALIDFREIGEGDGHYSYFAVLDPFTGNWRNDLVTRVPQGIRGSLGFRLSPDLTRVLYWDDHYDLVLADPRQPEGFIWKDRDYDYYTIEYIPAAWSPDSQYIAYIGDDFGPRNPLEVPGNWWGVFLLSRDGTERVSITPFLRQAGLYFVETLRWSSDSRYLAFVAYFEGDDRLVPEGVERLELFVYDKNSSSFIIRCPIYPESGWTIPQVFWSPGNRYIAYSTRRSLPVNVIDLQTGQVVQIIDHGEVTGWSGIFPIELP